MSVALDFCFKGGRTYIHGTDMFNKVLSSFSDDNFDRVSLSIHKMATNQLIMVDSEEKAKLAKTHPMIAQISFVGNSVGRHIVYLLETNNSVDCRYDYDEDSITEKAKITDLEVIELSAPYEFSFIEVLVALNKKLLQEKYPDVKGKWVFSRIRLNSYPFNKEEVEKIHLRFRKNLGFKLTETEIFINQVPERIGTINFSLI